MSQKNNNKDINFLSSPEKRNHQRLATKIDVNLVVDGKKINTQSTNISCGGMFVNLKRHNLLEQNDLELVIYLPDKNNPVKVVGKVNRIQSRSFLSKKQSGIAVKFNELYNDNILAIDSFIKSRLN